MGDKGNRPAARQQAVSFRDKSNRKVAPMYQQRAITTPVDIRATLTPNTQPGAIQPSGRYGHQTTIGLLNQQGQIAGNVPNQQPSRFSVPLMPYTPDDIKYRNRSQVLNEGAPAGNPAQNNPYGAVSVKGVGVSLADSAFFAYAEQKREAEQWSEFQQFIYSQVDFSTPAKRAWWEKKFPEYAQKAYANLEKQKQLELELDSIRIRGYKNMDDMWLKFLYDKGLLPGFMGDKVSASNADWLLYDYENMREQIGLPADPVTGADPARSRPVGGANPAPPGPRIGVYEGYPPDGPTPNAQLPVKAPYRAPDPAP